MINGNCITMASNIYRGEVTGVVTTLKDVGQGLVEYALILMLVVIIVVVILALIGPQIGTMFSNVVYQI